MGGVERDQNDLRLHPILAESIRIRDTHPTYTICNENVTSYSIYYFSYLFLLIKPI